MMVVSMFAGNDENQWLDQVEEEFGSDLSDNWEDEVMGTKTTIKIGIDAKASLAMEIKEKDYVRMVCNRYGSVMDELRIKRIKLC